MQFGYGKDKKYEVFPEDWIKPGEMYWPGSGFSCQLGATWGKKARLINRIFRIRPEKFIYFVAWVRKFVLRKKAIFWMVEQKKQ